MTDPAHQQKLFDAEPEEHDVHPDDYDRELGDDELATVSSEEVSEALLDKLKHQRHHEFVQLILGE